MLDLRFRQTLATLVLTRVLIIGFTASIQVPNLVRLNERGAPQALPDSWFLLESEQTTSIKTQEQDEPSLKPGIWRVLEYFNLKQDVSFSLHQNKDSDDEYRLLAWEGRYYYAQGGSASSAGCHVDTRHDHSTLVPWRYASSLSSSKKDPESDVERELPREFSLLGLGALWLNLAQDKSTECTLKEEEEAAAAAAPPGGQGTLKCSAGSRSSKSVSYDLEFNWSSRSDPFLWPSPRRAAVVRSYSISHDDQASLLDEVSVMATITKFEVIPAEQLGSKTRLQIVAMKALCQQSEGEILFPSLVRQMSESEQRLYDLSYTVRLYEEPKATGEDVTTRRSPRRLETHLVREWFSFERKTQTFLKHSCMFESGDRFEQQKERLIRMLQTSGGRKSAHYKMRWWANRASECQFTTQMHRDLTLAGHSRLMRRRLQFDPANEKQSASYQEELIGLGALLMNVADLHHKRSVVSHLQGEHQVSPADDKLAPLVQWVVDDYSGGAAQKRRWNFYFKRPTGGGGHKLKSESHLRDLVRIELMKRIPLKASDQRNSSGGTRHLGGLEDDDQLEGAHFVYSPLLEFDLQRFSTTMYQMEIERVFSLPDGCPPPSEFKGGAEDDAGDEETPVVQLEPLQVPANFDDFEFPQAGDNFLDLNYKISSSWQLVYTTLKWDELHTMNVVEYLMLDPLTGSLLARLEVTPEELDEPNDEPMVTFILDYTKQVITKIEAGECKRVDQLYDWLNASSSEMHLAGYAASGLTGEEGTAKLAHFGVAGIWSFVSREPSKLTLSTRAVDPDEWTGEATQFDLTWRRHKSAPYLKAGADLTHFCFRLDYRAGSLDAEVANHTFVGPTSGPKIHLESIKLFFCGDTGLKFKAIYIDKIKMESNGAKLEHFKLPESCRDEQKEAELKRKKLERFPKLHDTLIGGGSRKHHDELEMEPLDMEFKLKYRLILGASNADEKVMQVSEINLPHKFGLISVELADTIKINLWLLERGNTILLEHRLNERALCKRISRLEQFFYVDQFLSLMEANRRKLSEEKLESFPLATLWNVFSRSVAGATANSTQEDQVKIKWTRLEETGQVHTVWSLENQMGLLELETLRRETGPGGGGEQLKSVSLIPRRLGPQKESEAHQVDLRFMVEQVASSDEMEFERNNLRLPAACEQSIRDYEKQHELFPRLAQMLQGGRRLHMRSEISVSEGQASAGRRDWLGSYLLDEWLSFGRAYRSRLTKFQSDLEPPGDSPLKADYLMLLDTREYFDLSEPHNCKMEPQEEAMQLALNWSLPFVPACLFGSASQVSFYGPISMWLLAEEEELTKSLIFDGAGSELDLAPDLRGFKLYALDLFDEARLSEWCTTDFWQVTTKNYARFRMVFKHNVDEDGSHSAALLQMVQTDSWSSSHEDISSQDLDGAPSDRRSTFKITTEVVNYRPHSSLAREEVQEFDALLRIPTGFGCERNANARTKEKLNFILNDQLDGFNLLTPFQFEYEARLLLSGQNQSTRLKDSLKAQPVLNSGQFWHCHNFALAASPRLSVHRQVLHHLDGLVSSLKRVVVEDSRTNIVSIRHMDEASGMCRIELASEDHLRERALLELQFQDQSIAVTKSMLLKSLLGPSKGFQKLSVSELETLDLTGEKTARVVVYELKQNEIKLNDRLKGPGFIVKTFTRSPETRREQDNFLHPEVRLEFIISNAASLALKLRNFASTGKQGACSHIIEEAAAQECYEDSESLLESSAQDQSRERRRLRTFEMKFEPVVVASESRLEPLKADSRLSVSTFEFEAERRALLEQFQRSLFAQPEPWPVMQVGKMGIALLNADEPAGPSLVVRFNLLEPISLLHQFDTLDGRGLDLNSNWRFQKELGGSELDSRLAASKLRCADSCEPADSCLAFSYCQDRTCAHLLTHQWSSLREANADDDDDVRKLMLRLATTRDECTLYFTPTFSRLKSSYIDDFVAFARKLLAGPQEASKFQLEVQLTSAKDAKRSTRLKYLASELEELKFSLSDGSNGEEDSQETRGGGLLLSSYVMYGEGSELKLADSTQKQHLISRITHAQTLEECLGLCRAIDCQLSSFCSSSQACSLVANIGSWSEFGAITSKSSTENRPDCSVYSRDFVQDYERFERTKEPQIYTSLALNSSLLECAATCALRSREFANSDKSGKGAIDCLSFDYCHSDGSSSSSSSSKMPVCYLQQLHVIMEDFDERLLEQQTMNATGPDVEATSAQCSHYSKSLVADLRVAKGKRFASYKSLRLTNLPIERCAVLCRRSESCAGFEYCHGASRSRNSCYISRVPIGSQPEAQLEDSKECAIYWVSAQAGSSVILEEQNLWRSLTGDHQAKQEPAAQEEHPQTTFLSKWLCLSMLSLGFGFILGFGFGRTKLL